jgi:hypothetical protein
VPPPHLGFRGRLGFRIPAYHQISYLLLRGALRSMELLNRWSLDDPPSTSRVRVARQELALRHPHVGPMIDGAWAIKVASPTLHHAKLGARRETSATQGPQADAMPTQTVFLSGNYLIVGDSGPEGLSSCQGKGVCSSRGISIREPTPKRKIRKGQYLCLSSFKKNECSI